MERKFYPENFENFLKGHADQFKLTPSKKVWHGIYNDLHPGRRWPSIAMSMVLLFTLVTIGHLNTNNGSASRAYDPAAFNKPGNSSNTPGAENRSAKTAETARNNSVDIAGENNVANGSTPLSQVTSQPFYIIPVLAAPLEGDAGNTSVASVKNKSDNLSTGTAVNHTITASATDISVPPTESDILKKGKFEDNATPENTVIENNLTTGNELTPAIKELPPVKQVKQEPSANANNIRKPSRHSDITWTYFLAPSMSYRNFSDGRINDAVTHKPALGYEGGLSLSFNIYKKLQFTAGLQVNYSGYKILANNTHPIIASLVLNTVNQGQYSLYSSMSQLGNSVNNEFTKLKNYSLQASLPFGLQYDFTVNSNVKFGFITVFQPSIIIASKAYLLSEDKRNYLTDPDLTRSWNMNTSITPYVSFTSSSVRWQIGPELRYQLLSTYTNRYPVKEHLINYGIRIGISKITK